MSRPIRVWRLCVLLSAINVVAPLSGASDELELGTSSNAQPTNVIDNNGQRQILIPTSPEGIANTNDDDDKTVDGLKKLLVDGEGAVDPEGAGIDSPIDVHWVCRMHPHPKKQDQKTTDAQVSCRTNKDFVSQRWFYLA